MEVENNYKQSSDFQVYYFIKQEQSWGNNKGYYNNSAGYKKGNYQGAKKKYNKGYARPQEENTEFSKETSIYTQAKSSNPEHVDPYTAQMLIYRAEMYILMKYPYLIDCNKKNSEMTKSLTEKSHFYVIKSFSEEDVHKAIKYNVWSSTKSGNHTLNNSYKQAKEQGGEVYLIFSCNGSGRFVGVAKMASEVDFEKMFMFWTQDTKWMGMMNLEWVFIKDVPFREFKDIIIMMKNGERRPVSNSRDTQEVPFAESRKILEIIQSYQNSNTILEHFEYYDIRQDNYEKNNPSLTKLNQ